MTNLEKLHAYIEKLLTDSSEDRYAVRREIVDLCREKIADHEEDPSDSINLGYLHDKLIFEARQLSESGHTASWFYSRWADELQRIRGIDPSEDPESMIRSLLKEAKGHELPAAITAHLDKMALWFE